MHTCGIICNMTKYTTPVDNGKHEIKIKTSIATRTSDNICRIRRVRAYRESKIDVISTKMEMKNGIVLTRTFLGRN